MEVKQFVPLSPEQPILDQPEAVQPSLVQSSTAAQNVITAPPNTAAQHAMVPQPYQQQKPQSKTYTSLVESSKKFRKTMRLLTLLGLGLCTVLFAFGMLSQDAGLVRTMERVLSLAGIPTAGFAGLWFAQAARGALHTYQEGRNETDQNSNGRMHWFKTLKISAITLVILSLFGSVVPLLLQFAFVQGTYGNTIVPAATGNKIGGVASLVEFFVAIFFLIAIIKLLRLRTKTVVSAFSSPSIHWFLRFLICAVAFLTATGPVVIIVGFMVIQLYSHWCTLTNSKCY